eukprot:scaffold88302_cov55-Attheya_sp.AAC.1
MQAARLTSRLEEFVSGVLESIWLAQYGACVYHDGANMFQMLSQRSISNHVGSFELFHPKSNFGRARIEDGRQFIQEVQ